MSTPASGQISLQDCSDEVFTDNTQEVSIGGTAAFLHMIGQNTPSGADMALDDWYDCTAVPGENCDWGNDHTLSGVGTAWGGGNNYTQCVVEIETNGSFKLRVRKNGSETNTSYAWSPISTNEDSQYEVMWTLVSGPGYTGYGGSIAAAGVWTDLNAGGYWAATDASIDDASWTDVIDVSLRSKNANATFSTTVNRFTFTMQYTS